MDRYAISRSLHRYLASDLGSSGRTGSSRSSDNRASGRGRCARRVEDHQHVAKLRHRSLLHANSGDAARDRRRDLDDGLIRLDLNHRLIELECIARLNQPAPYLGLLHAFAQVGQFKFLHSALLRLHYTLDSINHAHRTGHVIILVPWCRVGRVVASDALHRLEQRVEAVIVNDRGDLGSYTTCARGFVDDHGAPGLFDGCDKRRFVEGPDGAQVDDFDAHIRHLLRGGEGNRHHRAVSKHTDTAALLYRLRLAQGKRVVFLRRLLAKGAVEFDMFQEQDGIGIGDGGGEQALGVVGIGGDDDLEAGRLHKDAFEAIGVQFGRAHAATEGGAHDQRTGEGSRTAEAHARRLCDELAHAQEEEARELDFSDRAQSIYGHAYRAANDARF